MNRKKLQELAERLRSKGVPDYEDEWERGFAAGQAEAGLELHNLLFPFEPKEADIEREALRIVNAGRAKFNQVQMLDTLNPEARITYRRMARRNLWEETR